MSISCGNPTFADDISLVALTPHHLQRMIDIVYQYCQQWNVSINVDKSTVTVFTKGRLQPVVSLMYGNNRITQSESFVHLGILYTSNTKNKDRISQRLQKARNAMFSLAAKGVHAQGLNPITSVDLYSKIIVPIALYGSELWNNLTNADLSVISRFQHKASKQLQGLPASTRSDMAESMVGLNRLPAIIEKRKLVFLHKLLQLPAGSVSRQIFIRKLIIFLNDRSSVKLGFVCDICHILSKYNLHSIINNIMLPNPQIPSKLQWKNIVNRAICERETTLWNHRLAIDDDFMFFRVLQTEITPSVIYRMNYNSSERNTVILIARLWTRQVTLENTLCSHCNDVYQEELVHALCECPVTAGIRNRFCESLNSILLPDEKLSVLNLDGFSLTLKLLGAPIEPIFDARTDIVFLKCAFWFVKNCLHEYTD